MPGDVYCTGCDWLRDRTELGRCVDGVYVSCEYCEDYSELLAEWDKVNERRRNAESALRTIIGLHDEDDGPHNHCHECGNVVPCDTVLVVRTALGSGKS